MNGAKELNRNPVDEAGVRLAPAPITSDAEKRMPSVRQDFVIVPSLEYGEKTAGSAPVGSTAVSTAHDYQPKSRDISKRWRRTARMRNFAAGIIMFLFSALVLLPFVLAAAGAKVNLPFRLVPEQYDVIGNWIDAFQATADAGWQAAAVKTVWLNMIPSMLLSIGIVAVLVNLVRSVFGMCGAIKSRYYAAGAVVFLLSVVAVFVAALVGADSIGVGQIDFMQDFIRGWKSSEFFTLFVLGGANLIAAAVCSLLTPKRTGYTR